MNQLLFRVVTGALSGAFITWFFLVLQLDFMVLVGRGLCVGSG